MIVGVTRKGKKVFRVWQVKQGNHELITGKNGFSRQDHLDAVHMLHTAAQNELGENGPTEFYDQFRRLEEMHAMQVPPGEGPKPTPTLAQSAHQ